MFPINVVEKETGISKYLLRMWERRYSFPRPARDSKGERIYSNEDVDKLKHIKMLMEEGYRPSKVIGQSLDELKGLLNSFNKTMPNNSTFESIILITPPNLEQELRSALRNHVVKKILVISSSDDIKNLAL